MADSFINRYTAFTRLPGNISEFGVTKEQIDIERGKPDANPVASPMPDARVSDLRLGLKRTGSDTMRGIAPTEPVANPFQGAKSNLSLTRGAVAKLRGGAVRAIRGMVDSNVVGDGNLSALMDDSLNRANTLLAYLEGDVKSRDFVQAMQASLGGAKPQSGKGSLPTNLR